MIRQTACTLRIWSPNLNSAQQRNPAPWTTSTGVAAPAPGQRPRQSNCKATRHNMGTPTEACAPNLAHALLAPLVREGASGRRRRPHSRSSASIAKPNKKCGRKRASHKHLFCRVALLSPPSARVADFDEEGNGRVDAGTLPATEGPKSGNTGKRKQATPPAPPMPKIRARAYGDERPRLA